MRRLFILLLLPVLAAAEPSGRAAFVVGEPVRLVLEYPGGVEGWDARLVLGEGPVLHAQNAARLVVTRGDGPFVRPSGDVLENWQTFLAPRGELVPPRPGRLTRAGYPVALPHPFRVEFDLAEIFAVDAPGLYTVFWGMEGVWEQALELEILEERPCGSD